MTLPRIIKRGLSVDEFLAKMAGREFTAGDIETHMRPRDLRATIAGLHSADAVTAERLTGDESGASAYRETAGHRRARERRQERAQAFFAGLAARKAEKASSGPENGGCA